MILACAAAWACDTPVYRYSIEHWPEDAYQAVLFHPGPVTEAQEALLETLQHPGSAAKEGESLATPLPKVRVQRVDTAADMEEGLRALLDKQAPPEWPWLVLRYPFAPPQAGTLWAGPLTEENVAQLLHSPARHETAQRLTKGDAAVCLFLESGDAAKDTKAFQTLERELKTAPGLITTAPAPIGEEDTVAESSDGEHSAPKPPAFSIVRVRRDDPEEAFLVDMLLGTEADLREFDEPMAFPVFGRGRALYALIGAGINADTIREACAFICGACTCIVKAENPGTDLLIGIDWDAALRGQPLPELPSTPPAPPAVPDIEIPSAEGTTALVLGLVLGGAFAVFAGLTLVLARRRIS